MRIALVSPLFESVPPLLYGGTERVVSYLAEALVGLGHDVTLYASGDSVTAARLKPMCDRALRLDKDCRDKTAPHMYMVERVFQDSGDFDVIHFNIDHFHYPLWRRQPVAGLTTLHGRLDLPEMHPFAREFMDHPVVSISDSQRDPLPEINWQATVYHGLPPDLYSRREGQGGYLAFLGRISPEKGPEQAIDIAVRAGVPLLIAAKVDEADQAYFKNVVKPLLRHPLVEFVGEIGDRDKEEFLGQALGMLFPIAWPEPFGLVMIEAMACGTPVIAYPCGSVPEILEDGVTGFLARTPQEAALSVARLPALDRRAIRGVFEERFTTERMAQDYVDVYRRVAATAGSIDNEETHSAWKTSAPQRVSTIS